MDGVWPHHGDGRKRLVAERHGRRSLLHLVAHGAAGDGAEAVSAARSGKGTCGRRLGRE